MEVLWGSGFIQEVEESLRRLLWSTGLWRYNRILHEVQGTFRRLKGPSGGLRILHEVQGTFMSGFGFQGFKVWQILFFKDPNKAPNTS